MKVLVGSKPGLWFRELQESWIAGPFSVKELSISLEREGGNKLLKT